MSIIVNPTASVPGGLANPPASAPAAGESPIPTNPRQRVAFARDLSIGLFVECAWLVDFAGLAVRRHRRLRGALTFLGPDGYGHFDPVHELALFTSTTEPRRHAIGWAAHIVAKLIESLTDTYDGCSAGVLTIGPVAAPNAHIAAVELGRRFAKVYDRHADELHPVAGWKPEDYPQPVYRPRVTRRVRPNETTFTINYFETPVPDYCIPSADQSRLTRMWTRKARRFRGRLLDLIGADYDRDCRKWIASVKVEAGKVLAGLPLDGPTMTYEEGQIIAALTSGGQRLRQGPLLAAAKLDPDNGTHKKILADMRGRGWINNNGKGYGLNEWK